ncbi:MAG TPA: histidine kinase [Thermoanaerobaculia bacterium]
MTFRHFRQLALQAFLIVAAWLFFGWLFGKNHHEAAIVRGSVESRLQHFGALAAAVLIWAVLTPIVMFVAERLPIRAPHRMRNLVLLVLFALVIATGKATIDSHLAGYLGPRLTPDEFFASVRWLLHTHFLLVMLIAGITNLIRLQKEAAERKIAEARFSAALANARLRRLRADLHPHFLFNALNAVAALVHTEAAAAEKTLDSLVDLLQRSIASQDVLEVSLADEIAFVEQYLEIQCTRFGHRLVTEVEAEPALLGYAVPPLLLQPLVENAIVHGISQRAQGGRVVVRADRKGSWLRLQVRDNGPGCAPDAVYARGSIGVPNAKARLQFVYGDDHSLTYRHESDEFVAEVLIPMREPGSPHAALTSIAGTS